ncbi:MAG: hypothetical protein ACOC2C_04315 [Cyclonatronaceae bacterium]
MYVAIEETPHSGRLPIPKKDFFTAYYGFNAEIVFRWSKQIAAEADENNGMFIFSADIAVFVRCYDELHSMGMLAL